MAQVRRPAPKSIKPAPARGLREDRLVSSIVLIIGIIAGAVILIVQAQSLWFTQDDAFISYRYARHALDGHGLVFNVGERVEGYTNFLWVLWLIVCGLLGIDFDPAAKALGLASAVGMIAMAALLSKRAWQAITGGNGHWAGFGAAVLVGVNGSLAYWAVSGLETALFGFLITWAVWLWVERSRLVPLALALATMTRPEGGLVWLCLVFAEYILSRDWKAALRLLILTGLLLAPFGIFKLSYYGSLLPNPFYAKTGLAWEYVQSGLQYAWLFLQDYLLWGVALLPIIVAAATLPGRWRIIPLIALVYAAYVIIVGGDVLRPHRFFVPVVPMFIAAFIAGAGWIAKQVRLPLVPYAVAGVAVVSLAIPSWTQAKDVLNSTWGLERGLVAKMTTVASYLRLVDSTNFTLAASTIGKIAYDLPGRRVIDMLGLTDSTIARHPETIPGNLSTWKERNFNAGYVLSQDPDWILFSTGHKPSAPAERALILHSKFRKNYYTAIFPTPQRMLAVHRRRGDFTGQDEVWPTIELAHSVNSLFNALVAKDDKRAEVEAFRLHRDGPPDYALPYGVLAGLYMETQDYGRAIAYGDTAIAIDPYNVEGWRVRMEAARATGDSALYRESSQGLSALCPWLQF